MKILFLGTNGWYDTRTGNTLCILIETKKEYIILDAGNGIYKIDDHIRSKKPIYLFLSHYHMDHIEGMHILAKFHFKQGITILGPKGLGKFFRRVIRADYTAPLSRLKVKIRLREIKKNMKLPLSFEARPLKHPVPCLGYRFYIEGKTVAFCTDTGLCPNLTRLAKNADILISECSFLSGQRSPGWPHLNPELAAKAALRAKAKRLVLTHFDASLYTTPELRKISERKASKIFANTKASYDGMAIKL